ncbi:MAG: cytochrome C-551 [Rubrivivax sp.]
MKHLCIALALAASLPAWGAEPRAAFDKAGCNACHLVDEKLVGPALKDIAAKYEGQAGAPAALFTQVRQGGKGVFGPIPMPPHPPEKVSDADLNAVVAWILGQ